MRKIFVKCSNFPHCWFTLSTTRTMLTELWLTVEIWDHRCNKRFLRLVFRSRFWGFFITFLFFHGFSSSVTLWARSPVGVDCMSNNPLPLSPLGCLPSQCVQVLLAPIRDIIRPFSTWSPFPCNCHPSHQTLWLLTFVRPSNVAKELKFSLYYDLKYVYVGSNAFSHFFIPDFLLPLFYFRKNIVKSKYEYAKLPGETNTLTDASAVIFIDFNLLHIPYCKTFYLLKYVLQFNKLHDSVFIIAGMIANFGNVWIKRL